MALVVPPLRSDFHSRGQQHAITGLATRQQAAWMMAVFRFAIAVAAVAAWAVMAATVLRAGQNSGDPKPQRIVSTNLCTDQLVLLLADRERIASVTTRAVDGDVSNVVDRAGGIPLNEGRAEEILLLKPDLVVTDHYWNRRTSGFMEKLGVRVHGVDWADSIPQIKAVIRDVAGAIGESASGEAMVAELEARLATVGNSAKMRGPLPIRTIIFEPNGFTSGQGSLADELMRLAGLENLAASAGYGTGAVISIESIAILKPDLLLVNTHRLSGDSRAELVLRHPALSDLDPAPKQHWIPSRLWLCPGPWVAEAAERMVAAGNTARLPSSPTN
jgi:iron complex transport system substrate-binding protein